MFSKAVPIDSSDRTYLFKNYAVLLNFLLFAIRPYISDSRGLLTPIIGKIKCLSILGSNIVDVRPFTLVTQCTIFILEDWRDSEPIVRPWHQVSDDAFVRFSFVDLPELFLAVYLDSNSILQNVLQRIFLGEIGWMTPRHLNCS